MSTPSGNPITQRVSQKMKKRNQTSANDDPTEGDGRRWAKGAKYQFLFGLLIRWQDARDIGEMSTFYSRITLLFIRTFSWEHALDVEGTAPPDDPSEENLDAVLDVSGLTVEEIARRNVVYLDLRGKLQRWFRYHGTKSLKSRKPENSLVKIIKAFGSQAKAPRRMQTLQFYSKLYYDSRVKSIVDAEWPKVVAQAGASGTPPPKRLKHQNKVLARIFAAETAEFQDALKRQRDDEHEEEIAAWKASRLDFGDAGSTRSPEEFHEALDEASHWLPSFADALSKYLGLNVSVLLSGPIGSKGGRIDVKAAHAGKSNGVVPMIWPDYDSHGYKALLKGLLAFGNASFSEEECRRRALPGTTPDQDVELPGSSSRATTPSTVVSRSSSPAPVPPPARPVPPVLVAVMESAQRGKKAPGPQAAAAGMPAMPPPLRMVSTMRRAMNGASAIATSGAPESRPAEVAGGKVRAPPMILPSFSTSTTSSSLAPAPPTSSTSAPAPSPASAATISPSRAASPSISSTTSSTSSLIVLPPTTATSQLPPPPSLPTKASGASASATSAVLSTAVPSSHAGARSEAHATSPPPTSEHPGSSDRGSSPDIANSSLVPRPRESDTSAQPTAFSRVDAANCPPDFGRVVDYLMKHDTWGPIWEHCVATYVEIERYAAFEPCGSLLKPTDGRPSEVAAWMKRARKLVDFHISNVDEFADAWLYWWRINQPEDLSALNVTGANGIRLFLLTLAWWGSALGDGVNDARGARFADALLEVRSAFDHVLVAASQESEDMEVDKPEVALTQSRKRRRGTVSSSSVKKPKKGGKK
ncbi:hypothetical protein K466DRAFT_604816 [Polyporus arcularius HHB13444]|uniref:Uncharacterized protein n=1 Tax=Polyporus arcularius HHB13444 TaxID=1314778 RepID=A0A5C3NUP9_9APHY|nr:hypothetical protein K466DRAFT_604816 [Polyporus arcularius HHB13444]